MGSFFRTVWNGAVELAGGGKRGDPRGARARSSRESRADPALPRCRKRRSWTLGWSIPAQAFPNAAGEVRTNRQGERGVEQPSVGQHALQAIGRR